MIPKSCRLFGQDHAAERVVVVSSLGMEAGEQEHRNKNKCCDDERKVHYFRYRVSESRTFDHDRLLKNPIGDDEFDASGRLLPYPAAAVEPPGGGCRREVRVISAIRPDEHVAIDIAQRLHDPAL